MEKQSACDGCGSRRNVTNMRGVRSDHMNVEVNLCPNCWTKVEEGYGFTVTRRSTRKLFRVVDEKDIV